MNGFSKKLAAGLLTVAVLGGTGVLLAQSLTTTQTKIAADGIAVEQNHMVQPTEVVTVTATRRAS